MTVQPFHKLEHADDLKPMIIIAFDEHEQIHYEKQRISHEMQSNIEEENEEHHRDLERRHHIYNVASHVAEGIRLNGGEKLIIDLKQKIDIGSKY